MSFLFSDSHSKCRDRLTLECYRLSQKGPVGRPRLFRHAWQIMTVHYTSRFSPYIACFVPILLPIVEARLKFRAKARSINHGNNERLIVRSTEGKLAGCAINPAKNLAYSHSAVGNK